MTQPAQNQPVYLDNAATSFPKAEGVCEAVYDFMKCNGAAAGRGSHAAALDAGRIVQQCRQRLATLLDIPSSQNIAFTFNCTDGLNLLLRGFLRQGQRVVTTQLEHNSVLRPLTALQNELDVSFVTVPFDPHTGLLDVGELETQLAAEETHLVVVNHASNVTGVVQPVDAVVRAAQRAGVPVLIDAAQTAGHIPFSVSQLQPDFIAAAGHKGLGGPLGTGFVYVRDGLEKQLRPIRAGGTGSHSESMTQPPDMPHRLESGNLNVPGLAGLSTAVQWLLEQSVDTIHQHIQQQTVRLAAGLRQISGVRLCGWPDLPSAQCAPAADADHVSARNAGIVSFVIENSDSRDLAVILEQAFHIQCRAGLHCAPLVHQTLNTLQHGGTVRLSPGPWTTDTDIDRAVDAVKQIAAELL